MKGDGVGEEWGGKGRMKEKEWEGKDGECMDGRERVGEGHVRRVCAVSKKILLNSPGPGPSLILRQIDVPASLD